MAAQSVGATFRGDEPSRDGSSRELFWYTLGRLTLLYFVPLILLAIFFHLQYRNLLRDGQRAHLEVIAEHQANTFDLFLRERLVYPPEFRRRVVELVEGGRKVLGRQARGTIRRFYSPLSSAARSGE